MGIRYAKKTAFLEGRIDAEDAESLAQWLKEQGKAAVNLSRCDHVHAAVLQVLLALEPKVTALPADPWLAQALART
jgi:anti-anti-sigma regulatory factor